MPAAPDRCMVAGRARLSQTLRRSAATFLASSLLHELSQPLTAINAWSISCLNLAKQKDVSRERLAERLELLAGEAQRMTGIVREFRSTLLQGGGEFSKIGREACRERVCQYV